ncbi:MAG TPA: NAD(P)/FAD-dependent oxidoreductase [Pirellulales bacterium]|nr:NAD(P)/FAD-dependent oxidoreductase [Pirellulales bacterium]
MPESPLVNVEVVVVGAGAAGLLAAARTAELGRQTLLLEKNDRPGIKILMSGGTRCNLTHATDSRGIVREFGPPGRFLHSALAALSPQELIDLFAAEGVTTKIEHDTGKIFPASDRAADVLAALLARLHRSGCTLALGEPLLDVERSDGGGFLLVTPQRQISTERLLITTGGQSYPGSGTTGDGYRWAEKLGHTIVPPRPALTPITTDATWVRELQGVTISDVWLRVVDTEVGESELGPAPTGKKKRRQPAHLAERRGSLLFAHFGLSGPVALDVSRVVSGHPRPRSLTLVCDFLPNDSQPELEERLGREASQAGKKQIGGLLTGLLPRRLIDALLTAVGLEPERKAAELGRDARGRYAAAIKQCTIPVSGTRGFKKAEVTAGGVSLDEVDSRTMQSRLAPGLYFAGEVLDLDGPIGGYNFQAAFSTAWLAAAAMSSTQS